MFAPVHFKLQGASVLDVFGGTGALGLEAASRGAARVVIIEKARSAQQVIRQNIRACGSPAAVELLSMSWQTAFQQLAGERFDVVFVDPPYHSGQYGPVLEALLSFDLLAPDAQVVLESDCEYKDACSGYETMRARRYGTVWVTTLRPLAAPADAEGGQHAAGEDNSPDV